MELIGLFFDVIAIPANLLGGIQLWRWWRREPDWWCEEPETLLDRIRKLLRTEFGVDVASIIIVILMILLIILALFT